MTSQRYDPIVIRLAALTLALVGVVAGCDAEPESAPPILGAVLPPAGDLQRPIPITVDDRTGLVRSIQVAPSDGAVRDGVSVVVGRPTAIRLQWTGGLCDRRIVILLDRHGGQFQLTITTQGGGSCLALGISRAVTLDLSKPLDPATIVFAVDYQPVGP